MAGARDFRKYSVWNEAVDYATFVYEVTSQMPWFEKKGLCDQLQRAAVSISSNIAEGAGRPTQKELVHFLSFSLGSAYELETELLLARDLNYIDDEQSQQINADVIEVQKLVYSLMKKYNSSNSN